MTRSWNKMQLLPVLLVEDNESEAMLIKEVLLEADPFIQLYHVHTLDRALLVAPDVKAALLDLNLPDSQGPETFYRFNRNFPEVAVVVYTGMVSENLAVEVLQHGAQDYINKEDLLGRDGRMLAHSIRSATYRQRTLSENPALQEASKVLKLLLET